MMKFRKLLSVLMVALLLCMMLPSAASADSVKMAYEGGKIYLRIGPGTNHRVNGVVHDGDWISVVKYGDIWSKVETEDGRVGYIKNLYIDDGDDTYAAGTDYFDSRYSLYTTARLNLRAGASTDTSIITTLAKGAKITALGKNGSFYLVETSGGTQGYVSTKYVTRDKSGSASSSQTTKTKTVTASFVNVRAGGGLSYKVLRVLPKGTKVSVLKVGNYWTKISYGDLTGWIKNTYLK